MNTDSQEPARQLPTLSDDGASQIDLEERVSALLFDRTEALHEEDCQALSRDICALILRDTPLDTLLKVREGYQS